MINRLYLSRLVLKGFLIHGTLPSICRGPKFDCVIRYRKPLPLRLGSYDFYYAAEIPFVKVKFFVANI